MAFVGAFDFGTFGPFAQDDGCSRQAHGRYRMEYVRADGGDGRRRVDGGELRAGLKGASSDGGAALADGYLGGSGGDAEQGREVGCVEKTILRGECCAVLHGDGIHQRAMRELARVCHLRFPWEEDGAHPALGNEQEAGLVGAVERAIER